VNPEELTNLADRLGAELLGAVGLHSPTDSPRDRHWLLHLRILLLFPQLRDQERALLRAVLLSHYALKFGCDRLANQPEPEPGKQPIEALTNEVEQLFMSARESVIESGVLDKLTPVQRRYIDAFGLSNPLVQ
jgi:hypothetical protein